MESNYRKSDAYPGMMPPHYSHMYNGGWGLPGTAFGEEPGHDKPTRAVDQYSIFEEFRDFLMFTSMDIAIMGTAWMFLLVGYPNLYHILLWAIRIANMLAFSWLIGHFSKTPEFLKIRGLNKARILGRLMMFILGGIVSHIIFYVIWQQ